MINECGILGFQGGMLTGVCLIGIAVGFVLLLIVRDKTIRIKKLEAGQKYLVSTKTKEMLTIIEVVEVRKHSVDVKNSEGIIESYQKVGINYLGPYTFVDKISETK